MDNPAPVSPTRPVSGLMSLLREDLQALRANWYWFLLLGILLIVLGIAALAHAWLATIATALVFGYFLLAGAALHLVGAFFTQCWGGFFLSLLAGVLYLAAGFIIVNHPGEAAILYTLLLAVFFFVEGLFRAVAAVAGRFHNWGWVLCSGLITMLLGILIWRQWPVSGLWVIGAFLGIDLIFSGWYLVSLGLSVRQLPVAAVSGQ